MISVDDNGHAGLLVYADEIDRSTIAGGSDVPAILGLSAWRTPYDVWLEKKSLAPRAEITPEQRRRFERGHRLEPVVVDMLLDRLVDEGHDVELLRRNARYVDHEYPFMSCEIDFELRLDGEHVNGDCKTVHPMAAKKWGEELSGDVPLDYAAQFMYGLGITGRNRCIVAALIGMDDLMIFFVERDNVTIAAMRARVVQFWRECVLADVMPDPVDYADCYAMYQQANGGRIEATDEVRNDVFKLADVRRQLAELGRREQTLKKEIAEFMKPNAYLTREGREIATWKNQPLTVFDEKLFAEKHPKLYARYRHTRQIRVLRTKKGLV